VQERTITAYDVETGVATFAPDLTWVPTSLAGGLDKQILIPAVDVASRRTYVVYEILPSIDRTVVKAAAYQTAIEIATMSKAYKTARWLTTQAQPMINELKFKWASFDRVTPDSVFKSDELLHDEFMVI
jgi:hypothetical protein